MVFRWFASAFTASIFFISPVAAQTLWSTSHVNASACRTHASPHGPATFSQVVQGHRWPHTPGGAIEFIDHTAAHLNAAAIGRANDRRLADRLVAAARARAWTRLDFEGPGGPSPSFASAIVVRTTAYAVSYLRGRNAVTAAELREIGDWIAVLQRNSRQRAHAPDHQAAIILAEVSWAAAIGDRSGLNQAAGRLVRFLAPLRRNPYITADLRSNNEVMHHLTLGAQILRQNGFDLLNHDTGGHTLNTAIIHHARRVQENRDRPITTAGDPTDQARSIFRAQGWGTHLAWIPVVLSTPGSDAAQRDVLALDAALRRTDRNPYWGIQIGVHTGCLFGRR